MDLSKLIEHTTLRVNPNVNYGLWVHRDNHMWKVYPWWPMSHLGAGCPTWVREAVHVWREGVRGNSVLSSQFSCELNSALRNKILFIKILLFTLHFFTNEVNYANYSILLNVCELKILNQTPLAGYWLFLLFFMVINSTTIKFHP